MKFYLFILISLFTILNAEIIKNHNNIDFPKQKTKKSYEVAMSFYNNKNYKVSYEIFNILFKNHLENKKINFYLGRSAFELKKYDEAYSAYERILIKYPNENRAKLEIARINFIQKKYEEAKKMFLELKKEDLPKNVKLKIDIYLAKIDKKTNKNSVNGIFMIGTGFDSNIYNRATSNIFHIPNISGKFKNTTKDESSINIFSALFINHFYQFSDDISLKNNFLIYYKKTLKDSNKDLSYLLYNPALVNQYKNLTIEYGIFTDFLKYENQYYLNSYGINPKIYYEYSDVIQYSLLLKYQSKINKINKYKNKDVTYKSVGFNMKNILNKKYILNINISKNQERKKKENLLNSLNFDSLDYGLSLNIKESNKLTIISNIVLKNKNYLDIDKMYLRKRIDKEYNYNLGTLYILENNWINKFNINYNNVKSNIDLFTYKKNTFSVSFMKRF